MEILQKLLPPAGGVKNNKPELVVSVALVSESDAYRAIRGREKLTVLLSLHSSGGGLADPPTSTVESMSTSDPSNGGEWVVPDAFL